ncbi:hypothetical protein [Microvirga sp. TS319]|uniref:hypothetical protein n=1 Tax=Microvirga sp. TS319 TaxID=3241165 RepID=UPI00351A1CFB
MPARDEALAVSLAIVTALMVTVLALLVGALAGSQASSRASGQAASEPACSEWTNGCIVCARTAQGFACSTPGIACIPKTPHCLKP